MAAHNQDWENIGRNIQQIVDQAVRSQDYQKLNQTIRHAVNQAVDLGTEAVKRASAAPVRPAPRQTATAKNLPVLYAPTGNHTAVGLAKAVGGGILTGISFLGMVGSAVVGLLTGAAALGISAAVLGASCIGGIVLTVSGSRSLSRVSRFKAYCKALGKQTHIQIEQLARTVGRNSKFVRKELQGMIDDGLFLEGHLDQEQQNLITSHETFRHYEQSRLALEQRQREENERKRRQAQWEQSQAEAARMQEAARKARDPQVQDVLDRGNAFLLEIRRCNDAIPGAEISGKIDRMERIVKRIFQRAEAHPEIVPDLRKLMDYYLPMTIKLLNAYADMDAQEVQGQTITASKKEIEDTLDTLNLAFEKLLDSIFEDTALDVSSDISVLHTLLAQEGLVEDELTKLRKNM